MNREIIADAILQVLFKAGFGNMVSKNLNTDDVLLALSDYEQKFDDMREYILSHKITA